MALILAYAGFSDMDCTDANVSGRSEMTLAKERDVPAAARGRISARVPQSVQEHLQQAADLTGATLNQFVVQAALDAAEKVLARERSLLLSDEEARRFCQLLDHPSEPNAALRGAHERYSARKVPHAGTDSTFEFDA
ncbi:MAG: DUF1778 domain-containing protein [Microvirgula sp.]|uniref:type II toxin-antitoxin system TacA family antitoxin n=1 Tax=Microvirgula TaxID=57479 RepID=UPI0018F26180|nr:MULTISPECIES: DUF1778 domain-containing protein [Microvirgula]